MRGLLPPVCYSTQQRISAKDTGYSQNTVQFVYLTDQLDSFSLSHFCLMKPKTAVLVVFPPQLLLPGVKTQYSTADFILTCLILFGVQVTLRHVNNKVITPPPLLFTRATGVSIFGNAPPVLWLSLPTTAELFGSPAKKH